MSSEEFKLIDWIKKNDPDCIYEESGNTIITTEWLVGGFAGRGFEGATIEDAWSQVKEYLDNHLNHQSLVGDAVRKCGWPDYNKTIDYLIENASESI